jgi:hypothetical protein
MALRARGLRHSDYIDPTHGRASLSRSRPTSGRALAAKVAIARSAQRMRQLGGSSRTHGGARCEEARPVMVTAQIDQWPSTIDNHPGPSGSAVITGTAPPRLLKISSARKIRGCSCRGAAHPTRCPLCPDGDQILRRSEMTRCARSDRKRSRESLVLISLRSRRIPRLEAIGLAPG